MGTQEYRYTTDGRYIKCRSKEDVNQLVEALTKYFRSQGQISWSPIMKGVNKNWIELQYDETVFIAARVEGFHIQYEPNSGTLRDLRKQASGKKLLPRYERENYAVEAGEYYKEVLALNAEIKRLTDARKSLIDEENTCLGKYVKGYEDDVYFYDVLVCFDPIAERKVYISSSDEIFRISELSDSDRTALKQGGEMIQLKIDGLFTSVREELSEEEVAEIKKNQGADNVEKEADGSGEVNEEIDGGVFDGENMSDEFKEAIKGDIKSGKRITKPKKEVSEESVDLENPESHPLDSEMPDDWEPDKTGTEQDLPLSEFMADGEGIEEEVQEEPKQKRKRKTTKK